MLQLYVYVKIGLSLTEVTELINNCVPVKIAETSEVANILRNQS